MPKRTSPQGLERKRQPVGDTHKRAGPAVKGPAHTQQAHSKQPLASPGRPRRKRRSRRWNAGLTTALVVVGAIGVLGLLVWLTHLFNPETSQPGQYTYAVGNPGPGAVAPSIQSHVMRNEVMEELSLDWEGECTAQLDATRGWGGSNRGRGSETSKT